LENINKDIGAVFSYDIVLQKALIAIITEEHFVAIIPLCETDWQQSEKYGIICSNNYINENYAVL